MGLERSRLADGANMVGCNMHRGVLLVIQCSHSSYIPRLLSVARIAGYDHGIEGCSPRSTWAAWPDDHEKQWASGDVTVVAHAPRRDEYMAARVDRAKVISSRNEDVCQENKAHAEDRLGARVSVSSAQTMAVVLPSGL